MRILLACLLIVNLSACNQYVRVDATEQTMDQLAVTPGAIWNKVPSQASFGYAPTWTVNGTSLDFVTFFTDIGEGEALVDATKKEQFPVFRADMLPEEMTELVETTFIKAYNGNLISREPVQPVKWAGRTAFETSFEFTTEDNVIRKVNTVVTTYEGKLYGISYQATRMHYHPRYLNDYRQIVNSSRLL